jgi:hypothetical protein
MLVCAYIFQLVINHPYSPCRTNHSLAGFNILEPESCQKYGLTLWQLVFGVIRQYRGELGVYKYPLTVFQLQEIAALD